MQVNPFVLFNDLKTFCTMTHAIVRGSYKMPWGTLIWVLVCAVYFISPIDVLPDILPVLGFADDGAFLIFVLLLIHKDLNTFRQYQQTQDTVIEAEVVEESKHD
ncbi:MAG: DUF1232 domain-containing protein [Elusimicrobiaceae bacterium]|nr:DUF1232 domain-containing protein [Elusimicrobiaceae bacterium]